MKDQSQSRNGELIAKLQKHISPDRDALLMEVGKISEVMPERMAKWFVMVDDLLRECLTELQSAPSETGPLEFDKCPDGKPCRQPTTGCLKGQCRARGCPCFITGGPCPIHP